MNNEVPTDCSACAERISRLERRLERERKARAMAEKTAEEGLRELYERQMDTALLGSVAAYANRAHSLDEVLATAVEGVLKRTGWAFGCAYTIDRSCSSALPSARVARSAAEAAEPLRRFVEQTGMAFNDDPIGRAIEQGEPVVTPQIVSSAIGFARRLVALKCGMRSAVAVPILCGDEAVGVMEFMIAVEGTPRDGLLDLLMHVAAQAARVHERQEMAGRLLHDALHDPLTGLPNRQLFNDRLQRAVLSYARSQTPYVVLFIDLDGFKSVNDTFGHTVGDRVLLDVSRSFSGLIEANPVVAESTLARMGGDEFCVLLEGAAASSAEDLSWQIVEMLRQPVEIGEKTAHIGASIGMATSGPSYLSGDDVIRDADVAMYEAKRAGRSQLQIYRNVLRQRNLRREELLREMTEAVRADFSGFSLVYQPIVALSDGGLKGFEALARWTTPVGEVIAPSEFISIAEENGLIALLGEWVVTTALSAHLRFRAGRSGDRPLTMSINLSPAQLRPGFCSFLAERLAESSIEPAEISLELTEGIAVGDDPAREAVIRDLSAMGIRLSIDDFGTGYASFSYLRKFAFQTLKIDRSFVSAISDGKGGIQIIKTMIEMARSLGVEIVAEGAETDEHVDALKEHGCDFAQGYYFSRPVDVESAAGIAARQEVSASAAIEEARPVRQALTG